jgi:hypothetical protein
LGCCQGSLPGASFTFGSSRIRSGAHCPPSVRPRSCPHGSPAMGGRNCRRSGCSLLGSSFVALVPGLATVFMGPGSRAADGDTSNRCPTDTLSGSCSGLAGSGSRGSPFSGSYPCVGVGAIRDHAPACGGSTVRIGPDAARTGLPGSAVDGGGATTRPVAGKL